MRSYRNLLTTFLTHYHFNVMNITEYIKFLGESIQKLNEVSDVDVDWTDDDMSDADYKNLREYIKSKLNFSISEKDVIIGYFIFYMFYIDNGQMQKWFETHSSKSNNSTMNKLGEIISNYKKWISGEKITNYINKNKDN